MRIYVGQRPLVAKTCRQCGLLRLAGEYGWVTVKGTRYRNSECQYCKIKRTNAVTLGHQEKSVTVAVRHREPWTDQELQKLAEMIDRGLSGPVMALALNRTVYAVYTMRNRLKETPK